MITEEMSRVLRKLTLLGTCLNFAIGQNREISTDEITDHINGGKIFKYLEENFRSDVKWGLENLTDEDKWHLLGEWQSMVNAIDSERKLAVKNNGICLLLAYVIEGIQMRTFSNKLWPGPDPLLKPPIP
jgi:hypothetical protein